MWFSMASSCFSKYACLLMGRAFGRNCEHTYYLELFRADLEHNFRAGMLLITTLGATPAGVGLMPASAFPVSPSVQEAEAAAVQPPSTKGLALGDKDKQTISQGREWKETEQPRNAKGAGVTTPL